MLVSEIISQVRTIISDKDGLQVIDAEYIAWINQAMREIATDNELFQKSGTQSTVVGTANYALPADLLKLHSVKYNNQKLSLLSRKEFEEHADSNVTGNGTPSICYVWAGALYLYPTPNAVNTLLIDYIRQPTDVTLVGNTPEVPLQYHNRLIDYCLAMAYQQDGDQNMYLAKMDEFRTGTHRNKDKPEWENDQYPFMGVSDRDAGYEFSYE